MRPRNLLPPLLLLLVVVSAIEGIVRAAHVSAYILPRPSAVFTAAFDNFAELSQAFLTTAASAALGFSLAVVTGTLTAVAMAASVRVRRALGPYTVFFQTVPLVAVAPLLVIWFDAGLIPVAISAAVVAVFPVITNTLAGLLSTDPALLDLFKLYHAGPIDRLLKLKLPYAMPSIVAGLRVSSGLAVIGAVVGEFLVGAFGKHEGLGTKITAAMHVGRTDRVFAAVLATSLLGLLMLSCVNLTARFFLRSKSLPPV